MEIKINVEIGLTPRLENALAALFGALQGAPSAQVVEAPQAAMAPRAAAIVEAPQAAPTELRGSEAAPEAAEPGAQAGAEAPEAAEPVAEPVEAQAEPGAQPQAEPGAQPEAEPGAQPEAEAAEAAELAAPTDQEMRTFMDITIARFAGVDWQESKDGDVLKIRRSCTKCFKAIAAHLGAEKPTGLVGREKRLQFIAELDRMLIEAGSTNVEWYPF